MCRSIALQRKITAIDAANDAKANGDELTKAILEPFVYVVEFIKAIVISQNQQTLVGQDTAPLKVTDTFVNVFLS